MKSSHSRCPHSPVRQVGLTRPCPGTGTPSRVIERRGRRAFRYSARVVTVLHARTSRLQANRIMPVNSTHPEYDENIEAWSRARDVMAGEDAVKASGVRYLPRLDSQTDDEYAAYKARASFFNATARTAEGYVGLVFRRPPFIKTPEATTALGHALAGFLNDADMLGTPFVSYAMKVVGEVGSVGRAGTLIDWEHEVENRVYASWIDYLRACDGSR